LFIRSAKREPGRGKALEREQREKTSCFGFWLLNSGHFYKVSVERDFTG
jgi:hypothetical protein